jgi:hypothetical protein
MIVKNGVEHGLPALFVLVLQIRTHWHLTPHRISDHEPCFERLRNVRSEENAHGHEQRYANGNSDSHFDFS